MYILLNLIPSGVAAGAIETPVHTTRGQYTKVALAPVEEPSNQQGRNESFAHELFFISRTASRRSAWPVGARP